MCGEDDIFKVNKTVTKRYESRKWVVVEVVDKALTFACTADKVRASNKSCREDLEHSEKVINDKQKN